MSDGTLALFGDSAARERIRTDLDTTLFVEAGAGSGKTTALVDRVVALVTTGAAQLREIAAITFTEKAGAELRDRIRRALEQRAAETAGDKRAGDEVGARCRAALDQLDGAAIGTLHAFAQRLLTEHPVEAGLPPRVEVLDEVSSGVEFDARWRSFRDELLDDPTMERTILLLLAAGVKADALRSLAMAFDDNWDLVDERVPDDSPDPPPVHDVLQLTLTALDALTAERKRCIDSSDKLCGYLDGIAAYADALRAIDDEYDLLDAIDPKFGIPRPRFKPGTSGRSPLWPGVELDELRERMRNAEARIDFVRDAITQAAAKRIGSAVRRFTLQAAAERRAAGRLEFHDLLVLSRSLLRSAEHGPVVRARLHQRYRRLLLDEFQDTDPIQIELAVRIAAGAPSSAGAGDAPWAEVEVAPGHLFVVGDPKQSIYRFRRADIDTFLRARDRFAPEAGGAVELTSNFRTVAPVIDWVNHVFAALMSEPPELALEQHAQPDYVALGATRSSPPGGPAVAVLGRSPHPKGSRADEMRAAEACEVAACVARAIGEGWSVSDDSLDGDGWRPARLGDITILIPARTSLPFLEDALDDLGIPFRAESSSLVYATRAVRDVLMVLRAVDDPTNHLHIVSALRTPLLGCGDDDLFRFKVERRGHWNYTGPQPESVPADDVVGRGLAWLRSLYDERQWRPPSELLGRIVRDRRAMELGFAEGGGRARDVWRRLRFVVDQARAWSEATGGGLREYLYWVEQQTAEGARVAESVLPETDDDAVRIMTIHAAKGLEFPITILSGMSTRPGSRHAPAQVVFPASGPVGYRFGAAVRTEEWEAQKPIDEQMEYEERKRLLYVACTRAKDHLVVSLHRALRAGPPRSASLRTNAELLVSGMGDEVLDALPDAVAVDGPLVGAQVALALDAPAPPPPFAEWERELTAALARASRPTAVAATALTDEGGPDHEVAVPELSEDDEVDGVDPGLQKRPRDLDLPPWLKGRYGTAVGRAVHGVLQTVDLATGDGLDDIVAAQCQAEGVPDRAADVTALARAALGAPCVQAAAAADHWREVYACTPVEGRLLEGYVDLLYRSPDGLVVVDHKTAATSDSDELDRRVAGYRLQGASYALVIGATTGEPVTRVTFLFLTPDGAVERDLPDLDAAVTDVRRLVAAGTELVTA